ncbi:regulatory protein RecX [Klenkia sp. LSe6-5]|uniref:Regulatory protein RecX n=1 Tax=Klenkia sesuvii TaxID=3103137 RepID=A0ABU8DVF9_9ACTN
MGGSAEVPDPDVGGSGRRQHVPTGTPPGPFEVVDFDLLHASLAARTTDVVDFDAFVEGAEEVVSASPGPGGSAGTAPPDLLGVDEVARGRSVRGTEVADLEGGDDVPARVEVVDIRSLDRDGPSTRSRAVGRSSSRSAARNTAVAADVERPQPAVPDDGPADEAADDGSTARRRSGGRGRAGSLGRPRRSAGDPPTEYDDPEQAARQICLTALTGASRTRHQLAELLASRDIPADTAEAVLERFAEVGLVDDAAFAAAWVSSRQSGRGLSRRALADELRRKGVDKEVAATALEAVDPQDEWDAARALVARKVPGMRRLDTVTATRRLTALLGRKGYGAGLAAWVVREALEADGKAEDAAAEADDAPPDLSGGYEPPRRGLWSGRPLEEPGEVGEGLTVDGWARTRRPGRSR